MAVAKNLSSTITKTNINYQKTIDLVGQIYGIGGISTGGFTTGPSSAPTPTPPTTTTGPAAPTGPSLNLQALLAAIPIAQDGQVITSEYHNSLRAALIALAGQLGLGLSSATTTFTFAPAMLPIGNGAPWPITANFTAQSTVGTNPDGWQPVQLPDGQSIQSMVVTGKLTAPAPTSFAVTLFRESVDPAAAGPAALLTLEMKTQTGAFTASGSITASGAATNAAGLVAQLAAVQDLKLIDTSSYKYFLRATVTGAGNGTQAEIDAIQVVMGA